MGALSARLDRIARRDPSHMTRQGRGQRIYNTQDYAYLCKASHLRCDTDQTFPQHHM